MYPPQYVWLVPIEGEISRVFSSRADAYLYAALHDVSDDKVTRVRFVL